jgi:hypothetical protein
MAFEWRVFFNLALYREDVEGLMCDWGCRWDGMGEWQRTDEYLNLGSSQLGAKKRSGKKWEAKVRLSADEAGVERYVKRKYGKKEPFARYSQEVVAHLRELSLAWDGSPSFSGPSVSLMKRRKTLSCVNSSTTFEVCIVAAPAVSVEQQWASFSLEGDSTELVMQELAQPRYAGLRQLLRRAADGAPSLSAMPTEWLLGGYPQFVRLLCDKTLGESDLETMRARAHRASQIEGHADAEAGCTVL